MDLRLTQVPEPQGAPAPAVSERRLRIRVRGAVQGVGFRPFVRRLAERSGLAGFVLNDADGVLIEVEGREAEAFPAALEREPPSLARIRTIDVAALPPQGGAGFEIRPSLEGRANTWLPADTAVCAACLEELFDPASRFFHYPFVTCTECGPRFTIARSLPYDRLRTAMSAFRMCGACARDYADPASRRFHAEAIACPACGPRLSHPLESVRDALARGMIVALKGIGGFHLLCDAFDEAAVAELRRRKAREAKPFAVMVADLASAGRVAAPTDAECELLSRPARPIVLLQGRGVLAPSVAPGQGRLGVMLPYAPVHHLLFQLLAGCPTGRAWASAPPPAALVATSANRSGEPLLIDDAEAREQLAGIADLIVTHDRPILTRADDTVMAVVAGAPAYIRRARGAVPEPIDLGEDGPAVLAVGGAQKATVTVMRGRDAFVSEHLGDLANLATVQAYMLAARRMLQSLGVEPEAIACDLHPDFQSTRFALAEARRLGIPAISVQHHAAHLGAVAAEHRLSGPLLGAALDGYGLGTDGGAWGGELMRLEGAGWRRLGHLAPLAAPGGDRAAREPWRMGVAALVTLGRAREAGWLFPEVEMAGAAAALCERPATPRTTSMGRLFDAAAALLGLRAYQSYEAQAAMELEARVVVPQTMPGGYRLEGGVLDFAPLLAVLPDLRGDPRRGAELVHGTVAEGLCAWIAEAAARTGLAEVALGGGCLANRALAEGLDRGLREAGLTPWFPRLAPANDGGLSLGQAALARRTLIYRNADVGETYGVPWSCGRFRDRVGGAS